MALATLEARLQQHAQSGNGVALITPHQNWTYRELLDAVAHAEMRLQNAGVVAGDAVLLSCGFNTQAIASFLAVMRLNAIAVLCAADDPQIETKRLASGAVVHLPGGSLDELNSLSAAPVKRHAEQHPLVAKLIDNSAPGFVVFSSGSTGEPKAVLHDAQRFCEHLQAVAKAKRTIGFLAFDHIAGVDTLFYTLFAGGTLIVPADRSPASVCTAIELHRAQVLPVSPSFLKLLLVSPVLARADLRSLEIVTFGSEPPDPTVITRLSELLPGTQLLQKYGTSEFGAPRSKTKPGDSRWIKLDSENFQTRVENGILWVQASGTMLGYLNVDAPNATSKLEQAGWFCTGDRVEQDGQWLRILGRDSDLINVGGEKVFPAEVETVIEALPEVLECAVSGEPHPLMGNVVVAKVRLAQDVSAAEAKRLVRNHCKGKLARHAIPVKVVVTKESLTSERGKRLRN